MKMQQGKLNRIIHLLFLIAGLLVFTFICYKAATASFTHDESYTYLHYPHRPFMKILSFADSYSNNHILNTLLMKYSEKLFGDSEFALRLPNLLAFLVYMVFGWLIFRKFNRILAFAVFILLVANVPLVDLFGMARGYGLSIAFMIMSLYFFLRYFENRKTVNLIFFHGAALFACLASFTLLTFYLALIAIFFVMIIVEWLKSGREKKTFTSGILPFTVMILPVVAILYEPVRRVIKFNKLDFGGSSGFFSDTMKHLVLNSINHLGVSPGFIFALQVIFIVVVLFGFFLVVRLVIRRNQNQYKEFPGLMVSGLLLILLAIIFILQHHILGTSYPVARFSVFLYPLFVIHIGFLTDYFIRTGYTYVALPMVTGLAFVLLNGFVVKSDLSAFGEWDYDRNTKSMMEILSEENRKEPGKETISLGVNWLFEPTVNFYRVTKNLDWLLPADRKGPDKDDDYLYIFKPLPDSLKSSNYQIIQDFKSSNTILLKNRRN